MAYIYGTNGNDLLQGTTSTDYIYGYNGNDTIKGGGGSDYIDGGNGTDTLDATGANGNVVVYLNDNYFGTDGYVYSYTSGLYSSLDNIENYAGGRYTDYIYGSEDNNALVGNGGNDYIYGNGGNDRIYAGTGNDNVYGGDDDDNISGNEGVDQLYGGSGRDSFVFGQHDTGTGGNADSIWDFKHAEVDRINLSAIDAKFNVGGNQAFTFIGQANFTANHPGTVDYHFTGGGNVTVAYNTDNDAAAEGQIVLHGVGLGLVAGDFVL